MNTIENALTDAHNDACELVSALQFANRNASAVESLLILQLVAQAAQLVNDIKALQGARGEE